MRIGLVGMAVAFMFLAFFTNVYMFFLACILLGFSGLINPSSNAIISKHISDKEQGLAQAAFSSIASLSAILAQAIFEPMLLLGISKYQNAGFPFYFAFAFCAIAFFCAVMFERIFVTEKHQISHPQFSQPRRAIVFQKTDALEMPEALTVADSKNRLAFALRPSHACDRERSLLDNVSDNTPTRL
jgi:MFS family permease